ncbi:MAG: Holliday junction branch migration protein RuvA [Chloroflexota bacterium]
MISYLHGTLKRKLSDRVVIDVGGVGYDVFLPQFVMRSLTDRAEGERLELDIYYHVTERQPVPTLIGFNNGYEKRFFEKFISVEDIGPSKAARAMVLSVSTIARAIEAEDIEALRRMPGIGERTAKKMVATLRGRVTEEALLVDGRFDSPQGEPVLERLPSKLKEDGIDILTSLQHRRTEASAMIDAALKRRPEIDTVESLIAEVYRGESSRDTAAHAGP